MKASAVGEAVTHLPWLLPSAGSLQALVRLPAAAAWQELRRDPGAVLMVLRQAAAAQAGPALSSLPALLHDPSVLEGAARLLESPGLGFVDWSQPPVRRVYEASLTYACLAGRLAERAGRPNPHYAWVTGLLAPLGWLAVCAAAPDQADACLNDPALPQNPVPAQERWWGLDQAAIARRLARRWRLPRWLAVAAGHLDLPVDSASMLGADPDLFITVQLAVGVAEAEGGRLYLPVGAAPADCAASLGIPESELDAVKSDVEACAFKCLAASDDWKDARNVQLLRELLLLAAEKQRLVHAPVVEALENDADKLHRALQEQRRSEEERLQARKLNALAEFAAGAGHEINNPLAVISGQAQYLLQHEADPARGQALQAIVKQAQRIHEILHELMQFARPARPQKQPVDLPTVVRQVASSLAELAAQRRVQFLCSPASDPVPVYADPRQLQAALACLLRNAIEAAPAEGWAGVRLEMSAPERVDVIVEDSGQGPTRLQREHLFDPFYSGRQAGRGRGLGLCTAWRLAREQGGEVRFEGVPNGPTRFVLRLPREPGNNGAPLNSLAEHDAARTAGQEQEPGVGVQEHELGNQNPQPGM